MFRSSEEVAVFPSGLGWMTLVVCDGALVRLTFGHTSPEAAVQDAAGQSTPNPRGDTLIRSLIARLQAYATGTADDFRDVAVDLGPRTTFQRQILDRCRRIPYGATLTYGELATQAGSPRAARAVGNVMAANPISLVIPCHRVVASDGGIGGYSALGGVRTKRRLLELETRGARALSTQSLAIG